MIGLRQRSTWRRIATPTLLAGMAVLLSATGASAGGSTLPPPPPVSAGATDSGYETTAQVTLSGDGVGPGPRVRRVRIPATCWWAPAPGPWRDPAGMVVAFDSGALAQETYRRFAGRAWSPVHDVAHAVAANHDTFAQVAGRVRAGERLAWYVPVCRASATIDDMWDFLGVCTSGLPFEAFPVGAPAPPRVEPVALAQVARNFLDLPVPVVDRNPKVTAAGGGTLVGMATWFWVRDPASVGAPSGRRWVRAQVGGVWARVDASTTGLRISSPAGEASCAPGRATTVYGRGVAESSACTVVFSRASVGYPAGFPVQASAEWTATWVGNPGIPGRPDVTGTLPPVTRTVTVNVPVAEVQTIVSGVG